ncbi:MAG: asparagine synthetase B [Dehalococcoidia bacterium]|nr:asparagine synthetase B [Dehalococcoidia bacterium]
MSPVCGILRNGSADIHQKINTMMATFNSVNSQSAWVVHDGLVQPWRKGISISGDMCTGQVVMNYPEKAKKGKPETGTNGRMSVIFEGILCNVAELLKKLNLAGSARDYSSASILVRLIEKEHNGDLADALRKAVAQINGEYCLVVNDNEQIIIMRDFAGLRPLFYDSDSSITAFASQKKALWNIGLRNVKPLRAGTMAIISKNNMQFADSLFKKYYSPAAVIDDPAIVVDKYSELIMRAVEIRLENVDRAAVLVSGGVDSCLIAYLANKVAMKNGIKLVAYTGGVDGSVDIDYAVKFTREIGLEHKVMRLNYQDIDKLIPRVIHAVEERDFVQIEAGIGVLAAVEQACADGFKIILSGQGPDELWGGYSWYPEIIAKDGYDVLVERMRGDLERSDIETLDRENRIAMSQGAYMVFPFIENEIVMLAMNVDPRLKIKSADDRVGKHPHREAAIKLGLPILFADRSKEAAQHGTGIHGKLDYIVRKRGFTPEMVSQVGYNGNNISQEKLASSTRYGYLYADKNLWEVPQHIQFYFDHVAYKGGFLNNAERKNIEKFLKKENYQYDNS